MPKKLFILVGVGIGIQNNELQHPVGIQTETFETVEDARKTRLEQLKSEEDDARSNDYDSSIEKTVGEMGATLFYGFDEYQTNIIWSIRELLPPKEKDHD